MALEITVPRLGWSMEEGTFVRWLKQDGETVRPGDALFELEGEKAAQDIEAVDAGILRIPPTAPQPGTVVAVGAVIGYLVADGETVPDRSPRTSLDTKTVTPVATVTVNLNGPAGEAPPAAPSVRRKARELGVSLNLVAGSGPAGRINVSDLPVAASASPPASVSVSRPVSESASRPVSESASRAILESAFRSVAASPRARRVARELGIDWTMLAGSGRGGRVREQDVQAAIAAGAGVPVAAASPEPAAAAASFPVTQHRRTIAQRMLLSRQQTAPVTLTTRVDATNLVSLRQQFKASGGTAVPSYSDIAVKLVALALARHPLLMARWSTERLAISEAINIGLAVDTPAGLLVPVIRSVPALSLVELAERSRTLIDRARSGQLKANDMQGGVFTVTNLGSYGVDAFTPIINVPETAILGLGRIRREPAVVENQIIPRDQITLSLTFDHRVVDGAPAAQFLQTVSQAIEAPSAWLLRTN